jgi:hypothetical protein
MDPFFSECLHQQTGLNAETEYQQLFYLNFPFEKNFYLDLKLNEFYMDSINVSYYYQNILSSLKEKIYIYTKYFLLKYHYINIKQLYETPDYIISKDEDIKICNFFLSKFKKSIYTILYYLFIKFNQNFNQTKPPEELKAQLLNYKKLQDLDRKKRKNDNIKSTNIEQYDTINTQIENDIKKYKEEEYQYFIEYSYKIFFENLFEGYENLYLVWETLFINWEPINDDNIYNLYYYIFNSILYN